MMTPSRLKLFMISRLPIAYIAGVRLQSLSETNCSTKVKLSWWNQNPFRSMFWAVQGMAAELSTGILAVDAIENSGKNISMLVVSQKGEFLKKAKGRIYFDCSMGKEIQDCVRKTIGNEDGKTIEVKSVGKDESGAIVSIFHFQWSFKERKS